MSDWFEYTFNGVDTFNVIHPDELKPMLHPPKETDFDLSKVGGPLIKVVDSIDVHNRVFYAVLYSGHKFHYAWFEIAKKHGLIPPHIRAVYSVYHPSINTMSAEIEIESYGRGLKVVADIDWRFIFNNPELFDILTDAQSRRFKRMTDVKASRKITESQKVKAAIYLLAGGKKEHLQYKFNETDQ